MSTLQSSTAIASGVVVALTPEEDAIATSWRNYFVADQGRPTMLTNEMIYRCVASMTPEDQQDADGVVSAFLSLENPNAKEGDVELVAAAAASTIKSVAITSRQARELALIAATNKQFQDDMVLSWESGEFKKRSTVVLAADLFGIVAVDGSTVRNGVYTHADLDRFAVPNSTFIEQSNVKFAKYRSTHCLMQDDKGEWTVLIEGIPAEYATTKRNAGGKQTAGVGDWYDDFAMTLPWVQEAHKSHMYFSEGASDRSKLRDEHKGWTVSQLQSERDRFKQRKSDAKNALKKVIRIMRQMRLINAMQKAGAAFMWEQAGDQARIVPGDPIMIYNKANPMANQSATIVQFLAYDVALANKNGTNGVGTFETLVATASRDTGTPTTQSPTLTRETWMGNASENANFIKNKETKAWFTARHANGQLTDDEVLLIGWMAVNWQEVFELGAGTDMAIDKRYYILLAQLAAKEKAEAEAKVAAKNAEQTNNPAIIAATERQKLSDQANATKRQLKAS